ncbi:hypothetical protein GP486_004827 [Trichoglossum hirsutum]|uniref:N-acetylglucosamine-6-phosphate deacetylase n=1 Tax=Trichoglossum hirsutum TaxID=265104 RepID=A0A9P8LAC8_9PEZI|nr:hypothetical protein GP486_004827 [Trichoglossum hirsutum]
MPSAIYSGSAVPTTRDGIIKFTNCRLVKGNSLVERDLWISAASGKIICGQEAFYGQHKAPSTIIDLGGRMVSPGFIDVQLNGAVGFDFSVLPDDMADYSAGVQRVNEALARTGVTSYLPTLTSQRSEVYQKSLPLLGPSGFMRLPDHGAESLGAHCEGPFLSVTKNGIHNVEFLQRALRGFTDLEDCYGADNLRAWTKAYGTPESRPSPIKMITAAPEVGRITSAIPEITSRGIVFSIGHSESTYEQASKAVEAGATMVTHLFNAMRPLHHRNPGIFGVLGEAESLPRPFFGVIADGVHLHPTCVKLAFSAHPDGFILVTDAIGLAGLEDSIYEWTNGIRIVKNGALLTLEGSDKLAGSSITLIECVSNFLNWTGATIPEAIKTVTSTPARMLGLASMKGTLSTGADADIVVLTEDQSDPKHVKLIVDQVWKFGVKIYDRQEA